jgi:hypothetical protein
VSRVQRFQFLIGVLILSGFLTGCSAPPSGVQATLTAIHMDNRMMKIGASPAVSATSSRVVSTPEAKIPPTQTKSPMPALDIELVTASKTTQPTGVLPKGTATETLEPRKPAKYWSEWPLVPPGVSDRVKEIYRLGLELGNDPHVFSTVGDCQSAPAVFMGIYDSDRYVLGDDFMYLEDTIRQFRGSFNRENITVVDGLSVASALSPAWADPEICLSGETPLECEFRIHKPSIVFINLGTNWRGGNEVTHETYLKQVVEVAIAHGVVPILSSKGDNEEGDHRLNRSIAQVAYDYDLPFWNFWTSIRHLPDKGIDTSRPGGYLTVDAWARRSFTGLQALDAVWRSVNSAP